MGKLPKDITFVTYSKYSRNTGVIGNIPEP